MIFNNKKETRDSDRFYPKGDAYVAFSPNFIKRGPIVNISRGGLACLYFVDNTLKERYIDRYANIRCGTFTMRKIPFKIISDSLLSKNDHEGQRIIRKRSIMFYNLSAAQKEQIDYFLKNHTKWSIANFRKKKNEAYTLPK